MSRPAPGDYAPFYETYVRKILEAHPLSILQENLKQFEAAMKKLDYSKPDYAYAEGKWTVKQLLQHMIDTERIFGYRALRIARGDNTPLPGFDEVSFAANASVKHITIDELADELIKLRQGHITMFSHFSPDDLNRKGIASNSPVTVTALAYIMAGHVTHHIEILKDKYGAIQ